jgi:hypothetical protein
MRICPLSSKGLQILAYEMGSVKGMRKGAVVVGSKGMDMAHFVNMYILLHSIHTADFIFNVLISRTNLPKR